jgi:hypothetical protein
MPLEIMCGFFYGVSIAMKNGLRSTCILFIIALTLGACDLFQVSLVDYLEEVGNDDDDTESTIYVYVAAASGDDDNSGWSRDEPLKTLSRAVDIWVGEGSSVANIMLLEDINHNYSDPGISNVSNSVIDFTKLTNGARSGIDAIILSGDESGKTIRGTEGRRVLYIDNPYKEITLKKLTISGGRPNSGDGGGIYIQGGELFIGDEVFITGNEAATGGGVYIWGSAAVTLTGGKIHGNRTINAGNGRGGGVYVNAGAFTLKDGAIYNNTANSPSAASIDNHTGGGVLVGNTPASFFMEGGEIYENTAGASGKGTGGGVRVAQLGTFTMTGGAIRNNTSGNDGGGVYISDGTAAIKKGDVRENTARYGGGVYVGNRGTLNLGEPFGTDDGYPLIRNNKAEGASPSTGGGIVINYGESGTTATAYFYHGTVSGNTAPAVGGKGGGILIVRGTLDMRGGTVKENSAGTGPGIMVESPSGVTNSDINKFIMSGGAKAFQDNSVYLDKNTSGLKRSITLGGAFSYTGPIAHVKTNGYAAGDPILLGDGSLLLLVYRDFAVDGKGFTDSLDWDGKLL